VYAGLLIYAMVPEIPEDMMEELERRHFVRIQELKKAKKRNMSSRGVIIRDNPTKRNRFL
jgi:hypothetical protein